MLDKLKTTSKLKDIIQSSIISNNFERTGFHHNPITFYTKTSFDDRKGIVIDITSTGTNITCNPNIIMKGHNMANCSWNEFTEVFIPQFEDYLQLDCKHLNVTGFDFNQTLEMCYAPKTYFNMFRSMPRYTKMEYHGGTGVTFGNKCKSWSGYDKILEQLKNKGNIPPYYLGKNLLRIELGINQKMKQTLNLENINTVKDLTSTDIQYNIGKEWYNGYNKIKKQTNFKIRDLSKPPSMDIQDFIILVGLNEMTMEMYFDDIETEINLGRISIKQGKARKGKAFSIWNAFLDHADNSKYDLALNVDRLHEMDTKVGDAAKQLMII